MTHSYMITRPVMSILSSQLKHCLMSKEESGLARLFFTLSEKFGKNAEYIS